MALKFGHSTVAAGRARVYVVAMQHPCCKSRGMVGESPQWGMGLFPTRYVYSNGS
jgi:hypothetical protein